MKTSNKILIAFATALILIPVLGMVIVSATQYKKGTHQANISYNKMNFSTPTANMEALTSQPFKGVKIVDAKGKTVNVIFVKDEKFGIKIPARLKDLVTLNVDATGELQIAFKTTDTDRDYTNIIVYAPNINTIDVTNAENLYFDVEQDSISVNAKQINQMDIGGLKVNNVTVNAETKRLDIDQGQIKSLKANLKGTEFTTSSHSYDYLELNTSGQSSILIQGEYSEGDAKKFEIGQLVVNTIDKADVTVENITVKNCAGTFSDQTNVKMPAVILNQMFKK